MFRWRHSAASLLVVLFVLEANAAPPDDPIVRFQAEARELNDLSAAAKMGDYLFVASDETSEVLVLKKEANTWSHWNMESVIKMPVPGEKEVDIEAIAVDRHTLYVAGSHSLPGSTLKVSPNREHIFRFEFDPVRGVATEMGEISLRGLLRRNPVLSKFYGIKENGIDIEGLSVVGDDLYIGFRSPILQEGALILKMRFATPEQGKLLFVDLGGRGIRDMAPVAEGFFLLAGPPKKSKGSFVLFYWTGEDGSDPPITQLAPFDTPPGTKAEALTILRSNGPCHDVLLLFDGIWGGAPQIENVCVPES